MTSTTKKLKKFEQRVQQEVKKLQRTVYAKRLEHTRLRDAAMEKRKTETPEEREQRMTAIATFYSVFFINDIVGSLVVDLVAAVRNDTDIYRFTEKHEIEMLEGSRTLYEQRLDKVARNYGYYLYDMMDYVSEKLRNDIFLYRNAVQMQFMKNKLPKYELLALLETARSLAWYACQLCDARIKSISKYEDLAFEFQRCRITDIEHRLTRFADKMYKRYCPKGITIKLYEDANAANGVQIIANKIESGNMIAAAIQFADGNAANSKNKQEDEQ